MTPTSQCSWRKLTFKVQTTCFYGIPFHVLSLSAQCEPKLFGIQQRCQPLALGIGEFVFAENQICKVPPPLAICTLPPPPVQPPEGVCFPLAPEDGYSLQIDNRYQRGCVFVASYNVSMESVKRHAYLLTSIATPPNVEPDLRDGILTVSPIPGMVQLIPGVRHYHGFLKPGGFWVGYIGVRVRVTIFKPL